MKRALLDQKSREIMAHIPIIAMAAEVFSATNSWAKTGMTIPYIAKKIINRRLVVTAHYRDRNNVLC
jgi:hypothetical protein